MAHCTKCVRELKLEYKREASLEYKNETEWVAVHEDASGSVFCPDGTYHHASW